ncbi:MAG: altronate oxidoreductase, partial [Sediminibacterium sp.]|nr:altronate oxidoreductase [Sediminibacterium sp.]
NHPINLFYINQSIKEVLNAQNDWAKLMEYATDTSIEIIISNVTEKGLVFDEIDDINIYSNSYPGKLLKLLYKRWVHFNGDADKGWIILPTELIPNNGNVLLNIILKLAVKHNLPDNFINWIKTNNEFCNTLVDRIVTNNISNFDKNKLPYLDNLMINSEPFALWAIEIKNHKNAQKLSFSLNNNEVVITDNIQKYLNLKLRLLNATHTILCGICLLTNVDTVYKSMQLSSIKNIIQTLMFDEIIPCIIDSENITKEEAINFANSVIDRFNNPYSVHYWETIAFNFEEKMKTRVSFLIEKYIHLNGKAPEMISYGFTCFYIYMKVNVHKNISFDDYC